MREMSIEEAVRADYFDWLCDQIGAERDMNKSYWGLLALLHSTEFRCAIPSDVNRSMDGIALREQYFSEGNFEGYDSAIDGNCTVLEMLIALAKRINFQISEPDDPFDQSHEMFRMMLRNLGILKFSDEAIYPGWRDECEEKLNIFMDRKFRTDGKGGLFPLKNPIEDQRKIDIWKQMSAYLLENF